MPNFFLRIYVHYAHAPQKRRKITTFFPYTQIFLNNSAKLLQIYRVNLTKLHIRSHVRAGFCFIKILHIFKRKAFKRKIVFSE